MLKIPVSKSGSICKRKPLRVVCSNMEKISANHGVKSRNGRELKQEKDFHWTSDFFPFKRNQACIYFLNCLWVFELNLALLLLGGLASYIGLCASCVTGFEAAGLFMEHVSFKYRC